MEKENNLIKYIVYLTTNTVNNKIYIGVHGTLTPYKFDLYLGDGVKTNDKYTYKYSKTPFEAAVNKYGPDKFIRKTLKVFDVLQDALDLERWLVDEEFIKRKDTYNIALGGGMPPIKTKTVYQYSLSGEFIKEWNSITSASIYYNCSSSCIGRAVYDRTPSLGYLWTDYKYDIIDLDNFQINENKTYTYLYNNFGEYINEFVSIQDCAKFIEETPDKVSKSIRGKYSIRGIYYCSDIKYDKFPIPENHSHKNDKLYQYDLQGNFIKEWKNYHAVKEFFGKDLGIHAAIRLGQSCNGFQWSWEKVPNMKELKPKTKARKVGKYTMDGKLVQVFNTVGEAKKDTCGAPNVLIGKRKSAGGHLWKYLED